MPKLQPKDGDIFIVAPKALLKDERLSSDAKMLWLYLASMDFIKKKNPNPSQKHLAQVLGRTDRHIRKLLRELEAFGALKIRRTVYQTSFYEITLPGNFYLHPRNTVPTPPEYSSVPSTPDPRNSVPTKEHNMKEHKDKDREVNVRGLEKLKEMKAQYLDNF